MNYADEAIHAAIQQAQLLLKATKKKKTQQVVTAERDIVRATALSWFNNHRKQLTAVLRDADLAEIDKKYHHLRQLRVPKFTVIGASPVGQRARDKSEGRWL